MWTTPAPEAAADPTDAVERLDSVFRREAGRLTASLVREFGPARLQTVEDVVQETMVKALRHWSLAAVPDNPAAWLLTVARNQARDHLRREARASRILEVAGCRLERETPVRPDQEAVLTLRAGGDDRLRLMFMCCHPAIPRDSQVCLTLKTLCGLSVEEISAAYFSLQSTVAQRLVRAKKALRTSEVAFDIPGEDELPARLDPVLEVLYLLFNEGYSAHAGDEHVRIDLCEEAVYLTELLAREPVGDRPRVHALRALLLFQSSRLPARLGNGGEILLLSEQDRARWDSSLIARGFEALQCAADGRDLSRYHLEAGIAAVHAGSATFESTDWAAVVELYDALLDLTGSPVVALNRAAAVGLRDGPSAGLRALDVVRNHPALASYHLLAATEGFLHRRAGSLDAAMACYASALALAHTDAERRFLRATVASLETERQV